MTNKLARSWENGAGAGTLQSQPVWNRGAFWAQDFSVLHWSGLCVVGKMHPKGQELIWGMGCRISWNYVSLMIFYSLQILARKLRNFWTNWLLQLGALDWFSMLKKTVVLTNQAQPPATLVIRDGVAVKVLDRNQGQKWLGCMLTAAGSMGQNVDLLYHIQQGTKCFHSNRWILQNRNTSVLSRLKYFDSVVSSTVCFSSGHRTIYTEDVIH